MITDLNSSYLTPSFTLTIPLHFDLSSQQSPFSERVPKPISWEERLWGNDFESYGMNQDYFLRKETS